MLLFVILITAAGAILYGAARIILGWIVGAETARRFDAAIGAAVRGFLKLCVLALAALILWGIWKAITAP